MPFLLNRRTTGRTQPQASETFFAFCKKAGRRGSSSATIGTMSIVTSGAICWRWKRTCFLRKNGRNTFAPLASRTSRANALLIFRHRRKFIRAGGSATLNICAHSRPKEHCSFAEPSKKSRLPFPNPQSRGSGLLRLTAATMDEGFPLPLNERDLPHGKTFVCEICMTDAAPQLRVLVVDDYLTNPFDSNELRARIGVGRRIIGLHHEIDAKNKLLMEMANTDPLTGLPNRRAIEEWAERQLRGAARHGFPFWVVHVDLDGFKKINDSYGHEAGDLVLKKFAEILKKNTRASDISGRMGGDEFLLVMTHVDGKNIHLAVDRFRKHLASEKFLFGSGTVVTASFGISGFQGKEPPDFSMLVRRAGHG